MRTSLLLSLRHWFAARNRWQRLGLSMLAGALLTGGHPPVSIPWLAFAAVPLMVLLIDGAPSNRAAAWIGWGAGVGYFVTGLHWVGHAFLVDADQFAWLLPLGVVGLPAGLALFWVIAFWLAKWVWRDPRQGGILIAIALTLVEYARAHILTGFPWGLPGYIWVETPIMQMAAWIGPFGMTFLTILIPAVTVIALLDRGWALAGGGLAVLAACWIAGSARIPEGVAYQADAPVLRIVQPNAPQHLKWVPGQREIFYERLLTATAAAPDPGLGEPELILWPETAVYFLPATNPQETARMADASGGVPIVLGALHGERTEEGEFWSNALVTVMGDGSLGPRYDKHHLVPFGEYLPLRSVLGMLGLRQLAERGGFNPGPGPQTIRLGGLPSFSPLICYEAIFPDQTVADERPDWLMQLTNDAWFGEFAGPQQHFAQARIRAIEQGLPLVRAANTGISAVIDPYGRVIVSLGMHRFNSIDAKLPAPIKATLFSIYGDGIAFLLIVISGLFGCFLPLRQSRD